MPMTPINSNPKYTAADAVFSAEPWTVPWTAKTILQESQCFSSLSPCFCFLYAILLESRNGICNKTTFKYIRHCLQICQSLQI
ncbi:uncharacterized protein LOC114310095 isoform X2 [Camellia sinensis]|uniref:uncharacterized protein LOC114310095 isoform X2 n=1 Tax=Camellia sinensis TaxID=4442 RepID=UPI001036D9F4|nr:uncharacterized protein LOC114310095 isoform X2 [Camellia sinensis]